MTTRPEFLTFTAPDGPIGALRWAGIDGAPTILAIHGLTANAWNFDPLAHHLIGGAHLVAVDLRGRGRSYEHDGPFGIRQHASDIVAIALQLGGAITLVGHGMGAHVALVAAEQHSAMFRRVVCVDGGTPPPRPDGDPEAVLVDVLRPAIERIRVVWPDRVSYQAMWMQHPAFTDGIGLDLQRTLLADLIEDPSGFRAAINEDAVIIDGRDLLVDDEIRTVLRRQTTPTTLLRAPAGMLGTPPPVIPEAVVEEFADNAWTTVPGTNHYTVLLGPTGATAVAAAIRAELAS